MSRRECAELLAAVDAGLLAVTDVVHNEEIGRASCRERV